MSKQTDNYRNLAAAVGLRYDEGKNVLYGQKGGFELLIYANDSRYPYMLSILTSARNDAGTELDKKEQKELVKSIDKITAMKQTGNSFMFQQCGINNQEKLKTALTDSINGIISALLAKGYHPCCSMCGQNTETATFRAGASYLNLCPECEIRLRDNAHFAAQEKEQKKENVVGGIVGALLGSLLGVVCIVLLSQLGYVAALSGVIMAIGVLKGYEMLGKKLSKKGIVISIIIMIFMTYVGDRLDWAVLLASEWGESVFDCYQVLPYLLLEGYIEMSNYVANLVLIYLFLALGAVPTIISTVKERKIENKIVKVGSISATNYGENLQ